MHSRSTPACPSHVTQPLQPPSTHEPAQFGPEASDPTISRLIDTIAATGTRSLTAIRAARAAVRQRVWSLAGKDAPDADGQITVDLDGVLVIAHCDKQVAAATWKNIRTPDGNTPKPCQCFGPDGHAAEVIAYARSISLNRWWPALSGVDVGVQLPHQRALPLQVCHGPRPPRPIRWRRPRRDAPPGVDTASSRGVNVC